MHDSTQPPLLTIGLVVRNGEAHLKQTVESLLAQTFTRFELIIYDNCSEDRTSEIAEYFCAADPRVRTIRHNRNIGVRQNLIAATEGVNTSFFCLAMMTCDIRIAFAR
jgi:glycosyltransferase involved in cell wall biosynthesis